MKTKFLTPALLAFAALASAPADAAIFGFDLTGAYNASFTIDQSQVTPPDFADENQFIVDDVEGLFDGLDTTADSVAFNLLSFDGGLNIQLGAAFFDFRGPQLFSGTTAAPTFLTGSFALADNNDPTRIATLRISAVPEPATWGMMILGFGIAGYAMRRRGTNMPVSTEV